MNKTTVDLSNPSLYAEPDSFFYRLKRKLTYSNILRNVKKHIENLDSVNVLEIGTGSGFLVSFLEDIYPNVSIYGLEYDERLVDLTKSKIKKATIFQGNAEKFELNKKFRLIVSLQVIEHLYNPENMLECVYNHLEEGGVFIFTTPNLGCLSDRVLKEKWHGYRSDHVSLKIKSDWDFFVEKRGFFKLYSGSTFFSGLPILNKFPLGVLNWVLLFFVGSLPWSIGESYIGVFRKNFNN